MYGPRSMQGGYATWCDPAGPALERDTYTCSHCGKVCIRKPRTASISAPTVPIIGGQPLKPENDGDLGGHCLMCNKDICGPCVDLGGCMPWEKKFEIIEKGEAAVRAAYKAGMPSLAGFVHPSAFRRP